MMDDLAVELKYSTNKFNAQLTIAESNLPRRRRQSLTKALSTLWIPLSPLRSKNYSHYIYSLS